MLGQKSLCRDLKLFKKRFQKIICLIRSLVRLNTVIVYNLFLSDEGPSLKGNQRGDILFIAVHTDLRIYPLRAFDVLVFRDVSSIHISLSENAEGFKLPLAQLFNYRKLAYHIGLFFNYLLVRK